MIRFPAHKCGLYLSHNSHKDCYKTVKEFINEEEFGYHDCWINEEQKQKAIETNDCWYIQWYPDTPIGFCILAAADLDVLLIEACR